MYEHKLGSGNLNGDEALSRYSASSPVHLFIYTWNVGITAGDWDWDLGLIFGGLGKKVVFGIAVEKRRLSKKL
jgi:hypothetical protein